MDYDFGFDFDNPFLDDDIDDYIEQQRQWELEYQQQQKGKTNESERIPTTDFRL